MAALHSSPVTLAHCPGRDLSSARALGGRASVHLPAALKLSHKEVASTSLGGRPGRMGVRSRFSVSKYLAASAQVGGTGALTPELKDALDKFVTDNKVVLFMKGTKLFPQCGFSNTCVQILNLLSVPYETVNILEDEQLRQGLKEYSAWPTFPQLYIDGEFFGGCDITMEAFQNGELKEAVEKAMLS